MPHALRARFAGDIITEFLPPARPSNRVVILAPGMPGMPTATKAMCAIAKKGYWAFLPRYRGTWESGGTFLDHSPHEDILDVVSGMSEPFRSIWDDVEYRIESPEVYVIGSSFGGPAAILCSIDDRVKKAIAIAPVVDWESMEESETEPMDWLGSVIPHAFGEAYRFSDENWNRLADGVLYNPIEHIAEIDSHKLMMLHAIDDDVVPYGYSEAFAKEVGCQLVLVKKGGHLGSSSLKRWRIGRKVWKFLDT